MDADQGAPILRRHRLISAVLAIAVVVISTLVFAPSPARAECSLNNLLDCPGTIGGPAANPTCIEAPTPARPDTGMAGWFLGKPDKPSTGDPFAPNATVSAYDVYGYAGLDFTTYDLGCGEAVTSPTALVMTDFANIVLGPAQFLVALDNSVREYAYQPESMWGWTNDLVQRASDALHERVFTAWGGLVVLVVGLWLMWGARSGNMSQAVTTAGWAVLVMALITAVAAWPVKASTLADEALTGALGQVTSVLGDREVGDERPPAVKASGVLTDTVLYQQWLRGTLGSADSETAKKYGPDLYKARALSWAEVQEIQKDPKKRDGIYKRKGELWKSTAAKVKASDPDAYEYLAGRKSTERLGAALLALVSAAVVTPFDIMSALLILVAFLIIRLAVAFLPAIGTIGILRPAAGPLRSLLRTVVAAIINCVVFGCGSAIFLLAVRVITGTNSLAGWQQILLIWLAGLILWLLLRPYRRLTQLTGADPFGELAGGLGRMHRKVFGDVKQMAIGAAGTYLGDVASLEANDKKRAKAAEEARPESWSRKNPQPVTSPGQGSQPRANQTVVNARAANHQPDGTPAEPGGFSTILARFTKRDADEQATPPAAKVAPRSGDPMAPQAPAQASAEVAQLSEDGRAYTIYRPDQGYVSSEDTNRGARFSQAASTVAQAASAVRDAAVIAGEIVRSQQGRGSSGT